MRSPRILGAIGVLLFIAPTPSFAERGEPEPASWSQQASNADIVAIGSVIESRRMQDAVVTKDERGRATTPGETVVYPEHILRVDPLWRPRQCIEIPQYFHIYSRNPQVYLLFGEFKGGKVYVHRLAPIDSQALVKKYVLGLMAIESDDLNVIEYAFQHLTSVEAAIKFDAVNELINFSVVELLENGKQLDADLVRKCIDDGALSGPPLATMLVLLASCGNVDDIKILKNVVQQMAGDAPPKLSGRYKRHFAEVLYAYTVRSPKEGFAAIQRLISNPEDDIVLRQDGLCALSYLSNHPVEGVNRIQIIDAYKLMLDQSDLVDLAIEQLRLWGRWEMTDRIISLYGEKSHNIPIVKRSIIRFALCAPKDNVKAQAFLKERRAEDADRVKEIEQLLELERTPPKPEPKK